MLYLKLEKIVAKTYKQSFEDALACKIRNWKIDKIFEENI